MKRRNFLSVAALAAAVVAASSSASAQSNAQKALIDAAKGQGVVGEQADGYLGFRSGASDPDLQTAVRVTNDARRQAYAARAAETGVATEIAAARMFESLLLPRIPAGQWYRNAQGQWVQR